MPSGANTIYWHSVSAECQMIPPAPVGSLSSYRKIILWENGCWMKPEVANTNLKPRVEPMVDLEGLLSLYPVGRRTIFRWLEQFNQGLWLK